MTNGQKITPHLWFDKEAKEAAEFYTSVFSPLGESKIKNITTLHNTPSGDADIVTIELAGQEFMLLSAGPYFKFTPAVSFLVACSTKEEVDALWEKLSDGGSALMELGSYPFSERYGWTQDKYGLSWQIMFMGDRKIKQKIKDYFAAGTKVAWDVDLLSEDVIKVYRATDPDNPTIYRRGDIAEAEPAVPGWRIAVDELFS